MVLDTRKTLHFHPHVSLLHKNALDSVFSLLPDVTPFLPLDLKMIRGIDPIWQALLAGTFTWGITALGAALVFVMRQQNKKLLGTASLRCLHACFQMAVLVLLLVL